MAVGERDPHTGHMTTGHEWNGIKELNTPVPRVVLFFLAATFLFALGYWILLPAWPTGISYTKGLLGIDQRKIVADSLSTADAERMRWARRLMERNVPAIKADAPLMAIVRETGPRLFGDNCAACHGRHAQGGPGYPAIGRAPWLWGGDPETLVETIRVGINSGHPDTRVSQMLAFGRDQMLPREDILNVATYVRSLSGMTDGATPAMVQAGKAVFAANCVACHGEDARGNHEVGAPDLTDKFWIYGGDLQTVYATIFNGRQGQMPSWEGRLSPLERGILVLYLLDLRQQNGSDPHG